MDHMPTPAERTADLLYDDVRRLMAENAKLREALRSLVVYAEGQPYEYPEALTAIERARAALEG
jgi:ribosomal protein L13